MKFGDKLSYLRRKNGLSQEELGEKLNVTRQTVSKWELGQSKPDTDKLIEISKLLNIDFNKLANDEEKIDNNFTEANFNNDEVRPRKWLLILLIVIAIGIIIFLAYGYVTNKKEQAEANKGNGFFDIFNDLIDSSDSNWDSTITNQLYEQFAGTTSGSSVESLLDHIITNNKKNSEEVVTVIFEEINSSDPNKIKEIKRKLDSFTDYEVSFEYDEKGNIYEATIEEIVVIKDSDISFFNHKYESFYAGTTSGNSINNMLDDIITNNKTKPERTIRVIYGNVNTTDENEIRNLKKSFGDIWTNYEVILDYDDIGFVNQVTIEN